jgi:hypothetical protein
MPEAIASTDPASSTPAADAFKAAVLGTTPDAAPAADATTAALTDALTRADGLKLEAGLAEALRGAGLDPMTATAQEMLDFSNKGARAFFDQRQKEKKLRQTVEAEMSELKTALSGLALDSVFADTAQGEKVSEKLNSIKAQVQRLGGLESNLLAAAENGLLSTEALEAIRSGTPESANTIFKLLAQVQGQQAKDQAVKGAGVGTSVTQPKPDPAGEPDPIFATPQTEEYKRTAGFVAAFTAMGRPAAKKE